MACKNLYAVFTEKKSYNFPSDYKWIKLENTTFTRDRFLLKSTKRQMAHLRKISLFSIRSTRKLEHESKKKYW